MVYKDQSTGVLHVCIHFCQVISALYVNNTSFTQLEYFHAVNQSFDANISTMCLPHLIGLNLLTCVSSLEHRNVFFVRTIAVGETLLLLFP